MDLIKIDSKYFLYKIIDNIHLVITVANSEFGMHPKLKNYKERINFIKKSFNLYNIITVSQTHSNIILNCNKNSKSGIEADGLITSEKNCAIGVFTADCVPIFLFDRKKWVISVVHSGWIGTYNEIILNSIDIFIEKYNSNINDIIIYIGPHNKSCCYEIGDELIEKFSEHERFINNKNIFNGRNLNMLECIKSSIMYKEIPVENINIIDYCTYCSSDVKFYSYRKDRQSLNRIFSFIFIK